MTGPVVIYSVNAGAYLVAYDPDRHDGRGGVDFGPLDRALRFDDAAAALVCYQQQSTVRPFRIDGKPNRPLTAHTVEIRTVEAAAQVAP